MKRLLLSLAIAAVALGESVVAAHPIATFNTVAGSFQVELFEDVAPKTVENFLNYVLDGDFNNTFIHRSVPNFVIQGGGFAYPGTPVPVSAFPASPAHIPTDPPVVNEFHLSNVRGTIAMAKSAGDANSATSEWFINLADNNNPSDPNSLDNQNGGFTVFGQVIGTGMQTVDAIAQVPLYKAGGPYSSLPLRNFTLGVDQAVSDQHFVMIPSITTPPPWQNPDSTKPWDVSGDGNLTPHDVGLIVNDLNAHEARRLPSLFALTEGQAWYFDTNGDNNLSPQDVGHVVNALNALVAGSGAAFSTAGPGGLFDMTPIAANGHYADGTATSVPEPSTLVLFSVAAIGGLAVAHRRLLRRPPGRRAAAALAIC